MFLTASVDTRGMKGAKFSSTERERMYVDTLNYYVTLFHNLKKRQSIVFAENSGWDLDVLKQKVRRSDFIDIEYISLDFTLFDQSKGKSYNELLMMQLAISASSIIQNARRFAKITGRFPLKNIDRVLYELFRRGGDKLNYFGDCKDHNIYERLGIPVNGHAGESRFYAMTLEFWKKYFEDCYNLLNDFDGKNIEGYLLQVKRKTVGRKDVIWRLRTQPHFSGKGAHSLGNGWAFFYSTNQDSAILGFKRGLRQLIRWIMPWWWC